jgi:orotidine-5'-phosphate decarboxylase
MGHTLYDLAASSNHQLCLGFDPDLSQLPIENLQTDHDTKAYELIVEWFRYLLAAGKNQVQTVKFQSAFFEVCGAEGMRALMTCMDLAREQNLFTILDAKRGDIASTMKAYGKTCFETFGADALTVTPWLGIDTLEALTPYLKNNPRRTIYIVWLTSNPSGPSWQGALMADQRPLALRVYQDIKHWGHQHRCDHQLGFVLGATNIAPWVFKHEFKNELFLIPGFGAQGGMMSQDIKKLLKDNPASLIPVSRGILQPQGPKMTFRNWDDYAHAMTQSIASFKKEMALPHQSL